MGSSVPDIVELLLVEGPLDWRDTDGRPLGEQASRFYDVVETEVVTCPYSGHRRGKPMNRSGLTQIRAHWPFLVDHLARFGGDATLYGAWVTSTHGLAACWAHPEPVPAEVSALYKACQGFAKAFARILLLRPDLATTRTETVFPDDSFMGWLEQEELLVGAEQACGGSEGQILQSFRVIAAGTGSPTREGRMLVEATGLMTACIAAARRLVLAGRLDDAPDFGEDCADVDAWPRCLQLLEYGRSFPSQLVNELGDVDVRGLGADPVEAATLTEVDAVLLDGLQSIASRYQGAALSALG